MRTRRIVPILVLAAVLASACSESDDDAGSAGSAETGQSSPIDETSLAPDTSATDASATDETTSTVGPAAGPDTVLGRHAGESWFLGTVPDATVPADPDAEPIVLGMVNQENTPLGSYPELRAAAEAGVAFVNEELGGVGGRPIELRTCITSFSVEQSQACAQELVQEGVVAVVGGIDVTSNGSIPVFEQNGIPLIGGIPANLVEQRSAVNFYFSGGTAGAMAAFLSHAADNGAATALIAYGEFDAFQVTAEDYGASVGEQLGIDVELVSFPIVATDFLPVLTKAQEIGADAVIVLAAGGSCVPIMEQFVDLGLEGQLYMVGACAADDIVEAAGDAAATVIFNSEGTAGDVNTEGDIFNDVIDLYADEPAGGAGTVGLRGFMNLYSLLVELGPDAVDSAAIIDLIRSSDDRASFWGHSYTCDGNQVPGLPALCAPQQVMFRVNGPGLADNADVGGGWIDTVELLSGLG